MGGMSKAPWIENILHNVMNLYNYYIKNTGGAINNSQDINMVLMCEAIYNQYLMTTL